MYLLNVLSASASLIAISSATFHIVAQNSADPNTNAVLKDDTLFFAIGSSDDTHDNKCSKLLNGAFTTSVSNFFVFDQDRQCNNGLCLLQGSFTLPEFCGVSGTNFVKQNHSSFGE